MNISRPVILVDDDDDDHEIFKSICKKLGVCDFLRHFSSAGEFLDYIHSTRESPFVILCDINMPAMNGLDLRSVINENDELRKRSIPFIFFSTAATHAQVEKAYDLTVQGFFLKGNSFAETENRVRKILEYWSECKHPNSTG